MTDLLSTAEDHSDTASRTAFILSSAILAVIGCLVLIMIIPFAKAALVNRRLTAIPDNQPAQAAPLLMRRQAVAAPYRDLSINLQRRLANAHAALGQHDDAVSAAQRFHQQLTAPADTLMPPTQSVRSNLSSLGARFYNRTAASRLPTDQWIAYREVEKRYQNLNDMPGQLHLREHLDLFYSDHPWQSSPGILDATPTTAKPGTPRTAKPTEREPAEPRTGQPAAQPTDSEDGQWAIVIPGGAMTYNALRERLREIPAGTLVDILEHQTWDLEPMVHTRVFHLNRWISDVYIRAAHLHVQPGSATEIDDQERLLHLRRLQLLDQIAREESPAPQPTPTPSPQPAPQSTTSDADALTQGEARRQLRALELRVQQLQRELNTSQGPRRAEIVDDMRRAGYERHRLQQAAAGVVESLELTPRPRPDPTPPPPSTPTESPRLQRLRRELQDVENQLGQFIEAGK